MTNKIKHITTYGTQTTEQEITNKKYGTFIFVQTFDVKDGERILKGQCFKPIEPFHNGYEPKRMHFHYYGRKINPVADYDLLDNYKLEEVIIEDIESFSDFDKLYCNWIGMDHNVYSLINKDPLPTVQYIDLWGSNYDLRKAEEHLKTISNVIETKIKRNIVQNWEISGYETMDIRYVPDVKMINKMVKIKDSWACNNWVKEHFGLEQFKYPKKQSIEDDEDYEDYYE